MVRNGTMRTIPLDCFHKGSHLCFKSRKELRFDSRIKKKYGLHWSHRTRLIFTDRFVEVCVIVFTYLSFSLVLVPEDCC